MTPTLRSLKLSSFSWLVLRSQQKDPSYEKEEPWPSAAANDISNSKDGAREWGEDLDDWGDETEVCKEEVLSSQATIDPPRNVTENSNTGCSQVEELMKSMSIQEAVEMIPEETLADVTSGTLPVETKAPPFYQGPYYPASYIAVVEEPEASAEDEELLKKYKSVHSSFDDKLAPDEGRRKKESDRNKRVRKENGLSRGGATGGGEIYEKSVAKHGDKMFHKFYKQLSKCPQQILRYIILSLSSFIVFLCTGTHGGVNHFCSLIIKLTFPQGSQHWSARSVELCVSMNSN